MIVGSKGKRQARQAARLFWHDLLKRMGKDPSAKTALYVHFPFCEKKCLFCSYGPIITKDHSVENLYLSALIKEFGILLSAMETPPRISSVYFGGGTPTFFAARKLVELVGYFRNQVPFEEHHELTLELNPYNTDFLSLQTFKYAGFTTLKLGAVDFDDALLKHNGRNHSVADLKSVYKGARALNFEAVGMELVYGLPGQTRKHIIKNIYAIKEYQPDFICLYEYKETRTEPAGTYNTEVSEFYRISKELLLGMNYCEIGPGFFALYKSPHFNAQQNGYLSKNISGYSRAGADVMLGLGRGAISDGRAALVQNHKTMHHYLEAIKNNELPIARGVLFDEKSQALRKHIDELHTRFKTTVCDPAVGALIEKVLRDQEHAGIFLKQGVLKCSQGNTQNLQHFCSLLDPKGYGHSKRLFYPVYG